MKYIFILFFIAFFSSNTNHNEDRIFFDRFYVKMVNTHLEIESKKIEEKKEKEESIQRNRIRVTATAYNSVVEQCDADPWIAAWNDRLVPGMKIIAISRNLERLGLTRGVRVYIEELDEWFVVMDRMNRRWKDRIDIWMEEDISSARRFGKKHLTIVWNESEKEETEKVL